ncbi:hypothetical protein [Nocardia puris]|uniref:hypothetical protein n=1 Tax=Nocardia puris TaxID=208602 RepID=UPI000AAC1A13|nr:hypothetical protein [Nocardia puris]
MPEDAPDQDDPVVVEGVAGQLRVVRALFDGVELTTLSWGEDPDDSIDMQPDQVNQLIRALSGGSGRCASQVPRVRDARARAARNSLPGERGDLAG